MTGLVSGVEARLIEHILRHGAHNEGTVVSAPSTAEADVDAALHIHEHDAADKADRHNDQLRPEGPLQHTAVAHFLRGAFDQHVERPDDASESDHVERHRTDDFAAFNGTHLKILPLEEGEKMKVDLQRCFLPEKTLLILRPERELNEGQPSQF